MTLPTGEIRMSQVAAELGISASGLSLMDSRVRALAGRSSVTPNAMSYLRGKSAANVANPLPSLSASSLAISPNSAYASIEFRPDGSTACVGNLSVVGGAWFSPLTGGAGDGYWIKVVKNSGSGAVIGTMGSWLSLSQARYWALNNSVDNVQSASCTYSIANGPSDANLIRSGSLTLHAYVEY